MKNIKNGDNGISSARSIGGRPSALGVSNIKNDDNSDTDQSDEENNSIDSDDSNGSYNSSESDDDNESDDALDIDPITFFSIKERCYYRMINKFFKNSTSAEISKMINIVEGKSTMSLRILDWFVTKYSRKRIDCGPSKETEMFDVRISYKSQLKSYKKQYFDPFRRKKKFNYHFENGQTMKTTLGQLNFFKWAFSNNVIVYVEKNLKQISKEIKLSNKDLEKKKEKSKKEAKKKKTESGKKPTKIKKSTNSDDSGSGNIKINTVKIVKDGEVQFTLIFD